MNIENKIGVESGIKKKISSKELMGLSHLAYWAGVFGDLSLNEYISDCGSCGSFCSGGACTTCTGMTNKGYLNKYKSEKK